MKFYNLLMLKLNKKLIMNYINIKVKKTENELTWISSNVNKYLTIFLFPFKHAIYNGVYSLKKYVINVINS